MEPRCHRRFRSPRGLGFRVYRVSGFLEGLGFIGFRVRRVYGVCRVYSVLEFKGL